MGVRRLSDKEAEAKFDLFGDLSSLSEERYFEVYDLIFTTMSEAVEIKESGRSGDAEVTMSKWVELTRVLGVVVMKKSALKPELIEAANRALRIAGEEFAILIDDYPTQIYILPDGEVFIRDGSLESDLMLVGLKG